MFRACFAQWTEPQRKKKLIQHGTAKAQRPNQWNVANTVRDTEYQWYSLIRYSILFYLLCFLVFYAFPFLLKQFVMHALCFPHGTYVCMAAWLTLAASNRVNQNVIQPKILPANQERVFPPSFRCLHTCITALDDALSVYASEFMFFPFSNIFYLAVFGSAVGVLHHRRTMWTDAE